MSKILEDLEKKPNFEHPKEFAWIPFARTKTKKDKKFTFELKQQI